MAAGDAGWLRGFGWCRTSQTSCPGVVGDVSVRLYSPVHPNGQHRFVEGGGGVPWVVGSSRCYKSSGSYLPLGEEPTVPLLLKTVFRALQLENRKKGLLQWRVRDS